MASAAVFLALGGGAFALSRGSAPVRGGGKVVSNVRDVHAGTAATLLDLGALGKITVSCADDAKTSGWGFHTRRHSAYIASTIAGGPTEGSRTSGHNHGFDNILGSPTGFSAAFVSAQISGTAGDPKPLVNATLSVVNNGYIGTGNDCRFAGQLTRQP